MAERRWTAQEDDLLKAAVAMHGEADKWTIISASVPGRTNKACRKRWRHSLSPYVKKSAWTPEEDRLLIDLHAQYNSKWALIARHIAGRTDDACSKRYREALDPTLRRDEWTTEEDQVLLDLYSRIGGKWGQVGIEMNRSGLACRNRWRLLQRKWASYQNRVNQPSTSQLPSLPIPEHQQWMYNDMPLYQPMDPSLPPIAPQAPPSFDLTSSSLRQALLPRPSQLTLPYDPEADIDPILRSHHAVLGTAETSPAEDEYGHMDDYFDIGMNMGSGSGSASTPIDDHSSLMDHQLHSEQEHNAAQSLCRLEQGDHVQNSLMQDLPPTKKKSGPKGSRAPKPEARLSSDLPLNGDHSLTPYACGHRDCWPEDALSSCASFSTSRSLTEHSRRVHPEDSGGVNPFRCGLEGCGKSWKSVNGLQYHLQVSKTHFKAAIATLRDQEMQSSPLIERMHQCPRDGCRNQYKQLSGLRYHMRNGHPEGDNPKQLDVVPPTLAKKVARRTDGNNEILY